MNRAIVIAALVLLVFAAPAAAAPAATHVTLGAPSAPMHCFGPPCDEINAVCYILFHAYCLG